MRHIIPISGKDSLCTAIVQLKRQPELDYEFVFNPTGAELPVVFDWIIAVEKYLGKKIVQIGDDLESIIEDNGYWLPSQNKRYCTKYSKIFPFERWLGKDICTVYYGIRADETREGYINASGRITVCLPLVEENIDINGVYQIIEEAGLKPPQFFWQSVYDEVCRLIGGEHFIKALLTPWQIDMLFSWRSRANCYFCFNQRHYEWIGLLEFYPDKFWHAEKMEHLGSNGIYSWCKVPLAQLAKRAKSIKRTRIRKIVKLIQARKQGVLVFDDTEDGFSDILATTSCGLFCGK